MSENLSKTEFKPVFEDKLDSLPSEVEKEIITQIEKLTEDYGKDPWNHPEVKRIESMGVWRLKVGEKRKKDRSQSIL